MRKRLLVAFDVDGTLIDENDQPRQDVIDLLKAMSKFCDVAVWSGGGCEYAEMWVRRLKLEDYVGGTFSKSLIGDEVDIAFDDVSDCALGKMQVIV